MQHISLFRLLAVFSFFAAAVGVSAQGTAISYQGQLYDSGALANTNYDLRFAVFTAPTNGTQVSVSLTNFAVQVSNGLFIVKLDFGAGVFNGTANGSNDWMDIGVRRTSSGGIFTPLYPRQPIYPVPYALFATSASNLLGFLQSTQLVGRISSSLISGTFSNTVSFVNGTNTFTGAFTGDGSALSNLNASQLVSGTLADARLPADVARLGLNQVFTGSNSFTGPGFSSGANTYTGVNIFTNNGNSFTGNFFGNGLVGWFSVSANAVTANRDTGYMLLNSGLTTVTLPASASLTPVDIIRVSGAGPGGWLVKENTGQSIVGNLAAYRNSYLSTLNAIYNDDYGVAASADGIRIYTVGNFVGVNESGDSGRTWTQITTPAFFSGACVSVACSANGKIVYAEPASGTVEKSTDYGVTWSSSGQPAANNTAISCTADGSTLFMNNINCSGNGVYRVEFVSGTIYYSVNSGSSWVSVPGRSGVTCVAASSDCTRMVAGVSNGLLYASSDLGATWTTLTATNQIWIGAWMSPDGSKFAAAARDVAGISGGIDFGNVLPLANTVSTNSTVCGSQGCAVELQYIGGGQFIPVGSSGLLWAN